MPAGSVSMGAVASGLFGKVPDLGDFVTRRLPAEFVQPWDRWLEQGIAESRERLGSVWEARYQNAPAWRFVLAPGTCGDAAWAGVLQPSVDRVGRYFPLTLAGPLTPDLDAFETLFSLAGWLERLERAAAQSLDGAINFNTLDQQVEQVVFPSDRVIAADAGDDTLPITERVVTALKVAVAGQDTQQRLRQALRRLQVAIGPWYCVWYDAGAHVTQRVLLVTRGLPSARLYCAMLDGRWVDHGWQGEAMQAGSALG